MKARFIIFTIIVSFLAISCATVRQPIPLNARATLTQNEIDNLENLRIDSIDGVDLPKYEFSGSNQNQYLVSNIYVETEIRSVLMDIATQSGINIVPDQTVSGSVSLTLDKCPLEDALYLILIPGGYDYKLVELNGQKSYIVGKADPENSTFNTLTRTVSIKTNREAAKVMEDLSSHFQPYVKADGQTIIITASDGIIKRLISDIKIADKSKRMIEITAQFVMVEWEKGVNLGVQWSDINLSAIGLADIVKGSATALSSSLSAGLSAFLASNGYNNKIKTISEPRIVVEDGEKAELNITEEHLFLILSGGGAAYNYFTTKEVSVGIKLKVQPFYTRDKQIRLIINPEVADIVGEREFKSNGGPSQKLPIIARRSTETTLKVLNGETIAIGGLITKSEINKKSGIPFFRKIPIVGSVFGSQNKAAKETELVIFITSRVIG